MLLKHFLHNRTGTLIDSIDDIKHENKVFRISRKDFYKIVFKVQYVYLHANFT